jgi:S-adenosylmethionine:tRNA ribosyltransferase-isomerase
MSALDCPVPQAAELEPVEHRVSPSHALAAVARPTLVPDGPTPTASRVMPDSLDFELPDALAAREPPEARGLARDEVRLMVSRVADDVIMHTRFRELPELLEAGDVLVVNTSATINAALDAWRERAGASPAERIALHFSSPLPDGRWVVELRRPSAKGSLPLLTARPGERLRLPGEAAATLVTPFLPSASSTAGDAKVRLWIAELDGVRDVLAYLAAHGSPIRYAYVPERWPLSYYQTVFATEPGSAEMPSAGRAFTREILTRLEQRGVRIAPLVLHTGVASLESDEPPYPERYHVPAATAAAINDARSGRGRGGKPGRIVAVGTTVVRALETVASPDGRVRAGVGWTDLVITPERGVYAVDAMLTGLHAPRASHLAMLEAVAGRRHLAATYAAALRERYLWHEFGDLHLIMP